MKTIIGIFLCSFLQKAIADNSLLGEWSYCNVSSEDSHIQYIFDFRPNNVVFEAIALLEPSTTPCSGKFKFAIGSFSHIELKTDQFVTTYFSTYYILGNLSYVARFNKDRACGKSNWKIYQKVDCTDDKEVIKIVGARGSKTEYAYILNGDELLVIENKDAKIFKRMQKGE